MNTAAKKLSLLLFLLVILVVLNVHKLFRGPPEDGDWEPRLKSFEVFQQQNSERIAASTLSPETLLSIDAQNLQEGSSKQTTLPTKLKQRSYPDYFKDWPSAIHKGSCPDAGQYQIKDKFISVVIYMTDNLDSLPVQTFLSVHQFSAESGYTIDRVVLAYTNTSDISTLSHVAHIEYITSLASDSVQVDSVSAKMEWQAKRRSLAILKSNQVVVLDDTVVVNRDYLSPLLAELQEKPQSLIYPHTDSLVPWGVYGTRKNGTCHLEQMLREELFSYLYNITSNWELARMKLGNAASDSTPVNQLSAGLTGQIIVAKRDHLLYLLSQMKTDDVVELSILSWLCGDGVVAVKCSAVARVNYMYNYLSIPTTHSKDLIEEAYSLSQAEKTTSKQSVMFAERSAPLTGSSNQCRKSSYIWLGTKQISTNSS